jgi:hypothetical protein
MFNASASKAKKKITSPNSMALNFGLQNSQAVACNIGLKPVRCCRFFIIFLYLYKIDNGPSGRKHLARLKK